VDQINLTVNDLMLIIGNKTVELHMAQIQLAQERQLNATLTEQVKKHEVEIANLNDQIKLLNVTEIKPK